MATFLIERNIPGASSLTPEQLRDIAQTSNEVVDLARTIRDAQRARGLTADPRAFAVPLIVRSLRQADLTGEALRARGIDD